MDSLQTFARDLLEWYQRSQRNLPWRQSKDPYRIWISEIMLQQTTVAAVIPYFEKWIQKFPTIVDVARSREQTILKMWQGLGYYTRAKNIHRAAKIIVDHYQGQIPANKEDLAELPGFGPYTVGAVGSIAFNLPLTIVDANVRRVMMRQLALPGEGGPLRDREISLCLNGILPSDRAGDFNQALMELGALVCRPLQPLCQACPVMSSCKAFQTGHPEKFPQKKVKSLIRQKWLILAIHSKDQYLIQKRPENGLWGGLWEFPGNEISSTSALARRAMRSVSTIIGITPQAMTPLPQVSFAYTKYLVTANVFLCEVEKLEVGRGTQQKKVSLGQLSRYPLSSASQKILNILRNGDKNP